MRRSSPTSASSTRSTSRYEPRNQHIYADLVKKNPDFIQSLAEFSCLSNANLPKGSGIRETDISQLAAEIMKDAKLSPADAKETRYDELKFIPEFNKAKIELQQEHFRPPKEDRVSILPDKLIPFHQQKKLLLPQREPQTQIPLKSGVSGDKLQKKIYSDQKEKAPSEKVNLILQINGLIDEIVDNQEKARRVYKDKERTQLGSAVTNSHQRTQTLSSNILPQKKKQVQGGSEMHSIVSKMLDRRTDKVSMISTLERTYRSFHSQRDPCPEVDSMVQDTAKSPTVALNRLQLNVQTVDQSVGFRYPVPPLYGLPLRSTGDKCKSSRLEEMEVRSINFRCSTSNLKMTQGFQQSFIDLSPEKKSSRGFDQPIRISKADKNETAEESPLQGQKTREYLIEFLNMFDNEEQELATPVEKPKCTKLAKMKKKMFVVTDSTQSKGKLRFFSSERCLGRTMLAKGGSEEKLTTSKHIVSMSPAYISVDNSQKPKAKTIKELTVKQLASTFHKA